MTDHNGGAPSAEALTHQVAYFSYGSNLDTDQMVARCASARTSAARCYCITPSRSAASATPEGGAVANVLPRRGARVEGLIYQITRTGLRPLPPAVRRRSAPLQGQGSCSRKSLLIK